jgi:hypothetical protein
VHTLEIKALAAHGARGGIFCIEVPLLNTVPAKGMLADELAVGLRAVADRALHVAYYVRRFFEVILKAGPWTLARTGQVFLLKTLGLE